MDNVGFIGLGNMGLGMANNILEKNMELNVYNRTKSKIDLLNEGNIINVNVIRVTLNELIKSITTIKPRTKASLPISARD